MQKGKVKDFVFGDLLCWPDRVRVLGLGALDKMYVRKFKETQPLCRDLVGVYCVSLGRQMRCNPRG